MRKPKTGLQPVLFATTAVAVTVASLLAFSATSADARIKCRGNAQLSGGLWITTPYCEDKNLARVARSYGVRVSFNELRYSTSAKERVCYAIGNDNRVAGACTGFRPQDNGRRWAN